MIDSSALQVRNNLVVALADLCMHYTALVGGHIPRLAACLADPHALVRRQTLALLANLLSKVSAQYESTWPACSNCVYEQKKACS